MYLHLFTGLFKSAPHSSEYYHVKIRRNFAHVRRDFACKLQADTIPFGLDYSQTCLK